MTRETAGPGSEGKSGPAVALRRMAGETVGRHEGLGRSPVSVPV